MLNIEKYKDDILNTEQADITCCVNELSNRDCNKIECEVCKQHAMEWLLEEYKGPVLEDAEKEYLSAVIKPFREKVKYIEKCGYVYTDKQFIRIKICGDDYMNFPNFKTNAMYKGMELRREYTLEELGL
jgi:hypothetical protein|nr:MAG TPA: hypothetical protein [Caudoviricetes sp.]